MYYADIISLFFSSVKEDYFMKDFQFILLLSFFMKEESLFFLAVWLFYERRKHLVLHKNTVNTTLQVAIEA